MNSANVIIVEDEFLVAMQLEDIVLDCGHVVVATAPDMAAIELVSTTPHVALVDLNLRDGPTGTRIAHLLSERFGTQIIYVTANPGQIGDPAATALGVIHKPFSCVGVEDAIAYALDTTGTVLRPFDLQPLERPALLKTA